MNVYDFTSTPSDSSENLYYYSMDSYSTPVDSSTDPNSPFSGEDLMDILSQSTYMSRFTPAAATDIKHQPQIPRSSDILSAEQHQDARMFQSDQLADRDYDRSFEGSLSPTLAMPWIGRNTAPNERVWGGYLPFQHDSASPHDSSDDVYIEGLSIMSHGSLEVSNRLTRSRLPRKDSKGTTSHPIAKMRAKRAPTIKTRVSSEEKSGSEEEGDDDDADRRQRGRPRLDTKDETAVDRRRTQIRLAQRAYRQRKETTINSLKTRVEDLEATVDGMHNSFLELHDAALEMQVIDLAPQFGQILRTVTEQFIALAKKAGAEPSQAFEDEHNFLDLESVTSRKKSRTANQEASDLSTVTKPIKSDQGPDSSMDVDLGWFDEFANGTNNLGVQLSASDKTNSPNRSKPQKRLTM